MASNFCDQQTLKDHQKPIFLLRCYLPLVNRPNYCHDCFSRLSLLPALHSAWTGVSAVSEGQQERRHKQSQPTVNPVVQVGQNIVLIKPSYYNKAVGE